MSPIILGTHKLLSIADNFGREFNISFIAVKFLLGMRGNVRHPQEAKEGTQKGCFI